MQRNHKPTSESATAAQRSGLPRRPREETDDGDEDDIKRCDEARLAYFRIVHEAKLLQRFPPKRQRPQRIPPINSVRRYCGSRAPAASAGFSAAKRLRRSSTIGSRKNAPRSMRVVVKVKGPTESMPKGLSKKVAPNHGRKKQNRRLAKLEKRIRNSMTTRTRPINGSPTGKMPLFR